MNDEPRIAIAGGGLAGSLLAILLARRGFEPVVLEREPAFGTAGPPQGRSINLALASRGIEALRSADAFDDIEPLIIAMRGRMLHETGAAPRLVPYGSTAREQIYSVSRAALHERLFRLASERHGIEYRFEHECLHLEREGIVTRTPAGRTTVSTDVALACDGAGSNLRRTLAEAGRIEAEEALLDHGYRELHMPPGPDGDYVLDPHALHIWPRGGFMLIALPNLDRSFTATLFLPLEGPNSFAEADDHGIRSLFRAAFPDVLPLIPALEQDYGRHPTGVLGTVRSAPWQLDGRVLLLGDAAHAIVPFHGQGMNAAFEDCRALDALLGEHHSDFSRVLPAFEQQRREHTDALAQMALENYIEMRDRVRAPKFALQTELGFELERRFPERWIRRYAMVMFHPEIGYADALQRGAIQQAILDALTADARRIEDVDFARAEALIRARL